MQRILKLDELKVVKEGDTRRLSHHVSVSALLKILPAVLAVLDADGKKDPTAYGVHHQMANLWFHCSPSSTG